MVHKRAKVKYEVQYLYHPYGKKSSMIKRDFYPAISLKVAKEWERDLKNLDKDNVWNIEIVKLQKKEWY
jgi:hypothetical protein